MSCRFCFESNSSKKNPMISPCDCKGTAKYVHRDCLLKWQTNTTVDAHRFVCQTCQAPYILPTVEFEKIPFLSATPHALLSPNVFLSTLHLCSMVLSFFRTHSISLSSSIIIISTLVYGTLYGIQFFHVKQKFRYIGSWVMNRTNNEARMKPMTFVMVLALSICIYPGFPYLASLVYCHTLFKIFQVHRDVLSNINQRLLLES